MDRKIQKRIFYENETTITGELTRLMLVLTKVTLMTEKPEKAFDSISLTLESTTVTASADEKTSVGNCGHVRAFTFH
jgi:hypothetical protein